MTKSKYTNPARGILGFYKQKRTEKKEEATAVPLGYRIDILLS